MILLLFFVTIFFYSFLYNEALFPPTWFYIVTKHSIDFVRASLKHCLYCKYERHYYWMKYCKKIMEINLYSFPSHRRTLNKQSLLLICIIIIIMFTIILSIIGTMIVKLHHHHHHHYLQHHLEHHRNDDIEAAVLTTTTCWSSVWTPLRMRGVGGSVCVKARHYDQFVTDTGHSNM